jgi:hypothetical protein
MQSVKEISNEQVHTFTTFSYLKSFILFLLVIALSSDCQSIRLLTVIALSSPPPPPTCDNPIPGNKSSTHHCCVLTLFINSPDCFVIRSCGRRFCCQQKCFAFVKFKGPNQKYMMTFCLETSPYHHHHY